MERTGWEREEVDRLRTEQRLGVWHSGGLEGDGVGGRGMVETVAGVGRRFVAKSMKEEEQAARHPQKKREANETRKVFIVHGAWNLRIGLVDETKESCTGTRRAEAFVSP